MRSGGISVPESDNLDDARVRIHALQDEVKRLIGLLNEQEKSAKLLIQRDLELTKANEKLEQLEEAKSEFVSVAAHQLRTPLSGIKWGLDMLLAGDVGEITDDQRKILEKGAESGDRMIVLVNDLLDVDHIEAKKDRYEFTSVDLREVAEDVISDVKPLAHDLGVAVSFKNRFEAYPEVRADKAKIRAVVQNLIENAVRYSGDDGKVTIRLEENGQSTMKMSIEDNGIGISEEEGNKVFTKFYRSDTAVKLRTDGSGLGLFITYDIVKKHGGMIWFRSEKGKGTTFIFTIPKAH